MRKEEESFLEVFRRPIDFKVSLSGIRDLAIVAWSKCLPEMGKMEPSYFPNDPEVIDSLVLLRGTHTRMQYMREGFTYIKERGLLKEKGLRFPNIYGLIILKLIDQELEILKPGQVVLGNDYLHHLYFTPSSYHAIPYMMKDGVGEYSYGYFPVGGKLSNNELILAFDLEKKIVI